MDDYTPFMFLILFEKLGGSIHLDAETFEFLLSEITSSVVILHKLLDFCWLLSLSEPIHKSTDIFWVNLILLFWQVCKTNI